MFMKPMKKLDKSVILRPLLKYIFSIDLAYRIASHIVFVIDNRLSIVTWGRTG